MRHISVSAVVLFALPLHAQSARDWPRFLGKNFDSVAVAVDPGINLTAKPKFVWSLDVGEGYGIGVVADQRYFHFDAGAPLAREPEERLRCVDLQDGRLIWTQTQKLTYRDMLGYEDGPRSSPTIDGDRIFTLGVAGQLTCRNLQDGAKIWSVNTNQKYGVVQNFFGVGSSPLVLGGQVIVMVGGSPPEDQGIAPMRLDRVSPNGSAVVAFDRDTGKELWRCGNDLASYSSPRPIEIGGETLVLVFARSGLMAIDPEAGKVRWKFGHRADILESVNAMMPVVDGDHVFISECYEVGSALLKVDRQNAEIVWRDTPRDRRNQSMRCHWATPVLIDGFLYGCSGRNAPDSDFRCVEFKTGEVRWTNKERRIRSSVTRMGNHLVLLEERGVIQIIRPNPDKLQVVAQWDLADPEDDRTKIRYPCWAAPIVIGNKLFLRGDQRIVCLEFHQRS